MKNLYKYLLFFIIGSIFYILLNHKDRFSIGIPIIDEPCSDTDPCDVTIPPLHCVTGICRIPGGGDAGSACSVTNLKIYVFDINDVSGKRFFHQANIYYDDRTIEHIVELSEDNYTFISNIYNLCTDVEKLYIQEILADESNKSNFITDLKTIDAHFSYLNHEKKIIQFKSIIIFYNNSGASVNNLNDLHITFNPIFNMDAFTLYELTITPDEEQDYLDELITIVDLLEYSGDMRPSDNIVTVDSEKAYVLTEAVQINKNQVASVDESIEIVQLIRSRVGINFEEHTIESYTTFPIGYDYGIELFKLIYKSDVERDPIIRFGEPSIDGDSDEDIMPIPKPEASFRRLYYLSVTPGEGFVDGVTPKITLFYPPINDLKIMYTDEIFNAFVIIHSEVSPGLNNKDIISRLMALDNVQLNALIKYIYDNDDIDANVIHVRLLGIYNTMIQKYNLI